MKTNIIILFIMLSAIYACRTTDKKVDTKSNDSIILDVQVDTSSVEPSEAELIFPAVASQVKDFIPMVYQIDLEFEGDLNHDGWNDKVVVLINKKDSTALRPTLILLKDNDNYKLDKKSFFAVEPKYSTAGYRIYDTEDLEIDSTGTLIFQMYSPGPSGNLTTGYKYIKDELVLMMVNAYNMGAGGHTEVNLDLLKGIYKETNTNTMKEEMPSTVTTKKYKSPKALFEYANPKEILIKATEQ